MGYSDKIVEAVGRWSNNNRVVNTFLVGCFAALSVRSLSQQKDIDALETEKNSLLKTNKALKQSIWDWKQQLYSEAESNSLPVPLSTLKSIYGEAPASIQPQDETPVTADSEAPPQKFVV